MVFPSRFPIRNALRHSLIWLLFILYEAGVAVYLGSSGQFMEFFWFFLFDLGLFYFHAHVLMNGIQGRRTLYYFAPLWLMLELGVYLFGKVEGIRWLRHPGSPLFSGLGHWWVVAAWRGVYIMGLSTGYWFLIKAFEAYRRNHQLLEAQLRLSMERHRLENAFHRSQINAHLLFNSLNFIYSKLQNVSAQAADLVLLLSDSMRFALAPPSRDGLVSLGGEVEQIRRMLEIQRIRFAGRFFCEFCCSLEEIDRERIRIPPLILVNLVENVVKHGQVQDADHPARICLSVEGDRLWFHTFNGLRPHSLPGEGLGLVNTRRRLELMDHGRGELDYHRHEASFSLTLEIVFSDDLLCCRQ